MPAQQKADGELVVIIQKIPRVKSHIVSPPSTIPYNTNPSTSLVEPVFHSFHHGHDHLSTSPRAMGDVQKQYYHLQSSMDLFDDQSPRDGCGSHQWSSRCSSSSTSLQILLFCGSNGWSRDGCFDDGRLDGRTSTYCPKG